jgi:AraC-like DNA-binding protein
MYRPKKRLRQRPGRRLSDSCSIHGSRDLTARAAAAGQRPGRCHSLVAVCPSRGTVPAHGPVVGEGPLVRVGLSQLLFSHAGVGLGVTRVPVNNLTWSAATTIGPEHHVIYPYTPMRVTFEGAGCHVITPNEVVCQPPGQVYQRQEMHAGQELSVFAAVTPEVAHLVGLDQLGLPAGLSLQAWQLAHELRAQPAEHRHDLEFAGRAAMLVAATAAASVTSHLPARTGSALTLKSHQGLVDATREHLAASYAERTLPLARLAADVGASPYHLARVFRAVTGCSIHQYRMQLRLRAALAGLATRQPVTDLAMSCGFASPSHLSQLFRRQFKIPPSQLRSELLNRLTAGPPQPTHLTAAAETVAALIPPSIDRMPSTSRLARY